MASSTGVGLAVEAAAAIWACAPLAIIRLGAPCHDDRWPLRACLGTVHFAVAHVVVPGVLANAGVRCGAVWCPRHAHVAGACATAWVSLLLGTPLPSWQPYSSFRLHADDTRRLRGIDSDPFASGWREWQAGTHPHAPARTPRSLFARAALAE